MKGRVDVYVGVGVSVGCGMLRQMVAPTDREAREGL